MHSPHDIARSTIVNENGAHFDPDIVNAFTAHEQEFASIRAEFAERQAAAA